MIGKNLQKLRKQKNLTQEALAEAVGVARQTIVKWEGEESTPDLEMSGRLASALGVSLDDLVNAPEDELNSRPGMRGKHMFGLVTVGDKGQIVIPVRARRVVDATRYGMLERFANRSTGILSGLRCCLFGETIA